MYRERAQSYTTCPDLSGEKIFMFFVLEILLHYDTQSFFIIASVVLRALPAYRQAGVSQWFLFNSTTAEYLQKK